MCNKITMEMSICQAENGFSLDELVKKLAAAFENKAFADILKMNLQLTQDQFFCLSDSIFFACCVQRNFFPYTIDLVTEIVSSAF